MGLAPDLPSWPDDSEEEDDEVERSTLTESSLIEDCLLIGLDLLDFAFLLSDELLEVPSSDDTSLMLTTSGFFADDKSKLMAALSESEAFESPLDRLLLAFDPDLLCGTEDSEDDDDVLEPSTLTDSGLIEECLLVGFDLLDLAFLLTEELLEVPSSDKTPLVPTTSASFAKDKSKLTSLPDSDDLRVSPLLDGLPIGSDPDLLCGPGNSEDDVEELKLSTLTDFWSVGSCFLEGFDLLDSVFLLSSELLEVVWPVLFGSSAA